MLRIFSICFAQVLNEYMPNIIYDMASIVVDDGLLSTWHKTICLYHVDLGQRGLSHYINACKGPLSMYDGVKFQPVSEDVTYTTYSLIG